MERHPKTDERLIARVQTAMDQDAWSEFYALYRPVVLRMARKRGLQEADAEDVCQRILLSVSKAIGDWTPQPNKPFRAWLGTIARNAIVNAIARRPRDIGAGLTAVVEQLHELPASEEGAAEVEWETRKELFRRATHVIRDEFAPISWEMFWSTEVLGKSVESVAEACQRSTGAVYIARCRIMKRLREFVQGESQIWGFDGVTHSRQDLS